MQLMLLNPAAVALPPSPLYVPEPVPAVLVMMSVRRNVHAAVRHVSIP